MKNEYGERLDRNGYAPSIMGKPDGACAICGRTDAPLQRHEVFHGPYRQKAKRLGLWVCICQECHDKVHHKGGRLDAQLKEHGQEAAEMYYGWDTEEFVQIFGRNRL